jgi:L-arabinose isomerase
VQISCEELLSAAESVAADKADGLWRAVKAHVGNVAVSDKDGLHSCRVYMAFKQLAARDGLAGFTTECYPDLMGRVCLAHSLLSEEGIVSACEGDMNSALATLVLARLTGRPIHNTDLLAIYDEDNSVLLSHCGSGGFSLARGKDDITLGSVRLAGSGVCVLFPGRPGPVTMVNLVGRRGTYRMCAIAGEAVETPMVFPGNPLRVRCPLDVRDLLRVIADHGLGHHWMVGYGDSRAELRELAVLAGISYLDPAP